MNSAIEDNEQDWDEVIRQRDMQRDLIDKANENILALERSLKAARFVAHKMRLDKYKDEVRMGGTTEKTGKAKYKAAMHNYDVIIDLAFKGKGGLEHNDECVKKGWDDEG